MKYEVIDYLLMLAADCALAGREDDADKINEVIEIVRNSEEM